MTAEIWTSVQVLLNCLGMLQKRTAAAAVAVTPELLLRKATLARTSVTRAKYAQRGLAHGSPLDHTTRVLLLRQLYLSHMEGRRFADALAVAEQMVGASVMPDVARQDAARACLEEIRAALERGPDWVKDHLDSDKIEKVREFLLVEEQVAFRCREGLPKIAPQTVALPDRNPKRLLEASASSTTATKTSQTVADSDKTAPPQTKTTR